MAQSHPTSPMSLAKICNSTNDDDAPKNLIPSLSIDRDDPNVQLAAEALGDMARTQGTGGKIVLPPLPALSSSGPPSPSLAAAAASSNNRYFSFSSDSSIATTEDDPTTTAATATATTNYDIVDSAWRAYHGSTNMVKYGAEMVGSFYERYGRRSSTTTTATTTPMEQDDEDEDVTVATARILARTTLSDNATPEQHDVLRKRRHEDARRRSKSPYAIQPHHHHQPYPRRRTTATTTTTTTTTARQPSSTWQQLVVHASSAAGTTAAVISEESMKCLRYCLSWIQYAIHHIEQQMALLRSYLVSLAKEPTANAQPEVVTRVKKEMINTVRKVVEVVSKYAGSSLPQQAKETVRGFILSLPAKANANLKNTTSAQDRGQETPIKLLNFGGESIEMLQSVSNVFSDTVDRADLWLDRLRTMGVVQQDHNKQQPQVVDQA
ncbi:opi1-domain-containing protein [Lichtheimia corymbifera JMRC:FSU:9682]|uniref:Opi1-domain-containing protein n=1 Tax=Lichtheimia corymbifera JMRC:FSU:9682 TaxID=1263082 RepID=A0A068RJ07_9FUNG|nr:opi1-domain-containing protein [Lichtheimia corymbifera JMRC:FSU:9682]